MYVYIYIYVCGVYIYIYITRLASNEIFLPLNKIHREVGRAKDLSAPQYSRLLKVARLSALLIGRLPPHPTPPGHYH